MTKRFSGESERELGNYVWYSFNSNQAASCLVESLKPSDWGLFSAIGNVYEWTHTPESDYRVAGMAKSGEMGKLNDKAYRLIRGGSFNVRSSDVRSSVRNLYNPSTCSTTSVFGSRELTAEDFYYFICLSLYSLLHLAAKRREKKLV